MSIVVTGATGHLGRLVVEALLARGVPGGEITATGRRVENLKDLPVDVRRADLDDPGSLRAAFEGADRLLLVSGSDVGRRVAQHRHAIDAAKAAGVGLVAYTSGTRAATSSMALMADHKATEEMLRASGVPFALLRNCFYLEVYTEKVPAALDAGAILGSAGAGRVSGAARADLAEAAAIVLTGHGHEGAVYELAGDDSFTQSDLAEAITRLTGVPVAYDDLPVADYARTLEGLGLPEPVAALVADIDRGIAAGDLHVTTGDLSRLLGRPTTTLSEVLAMSA